MKLYLVERKAVFGITQGVFRKTVCLSPTTNSEHDRKYCKVLGNILKAKHYKSKDFDVMIQFILPVPGKNFGSIRIYDAFFTLKILGGILNDPDMKIVVSISQPPLIGRGVFIHTKEMSLDPNAFPIIPICSDDQVNLDKLHPVLDLLEDGSTSMLVTVSLEFEPRRRQEMLSKSITDSSEKEEIKPEKPNVQSKNMSMPCEKSEMQPKCSFDQLKESVPQNEELLVQRNAAVKSTRRVITSNQPVPVCNLRRDVPESIIRTIYQLNLAEAKLEEQEVKPEKLVIKSDPIMRQQVSAFLSEKEPEVQTTPVKSLEISADENKKLVIKSEPSVPQLIPVKSPEIESDAQIVPSKSLEVSAELSICRKILQNEIGSDAIIMTKEGVLVNCHKSFLMAHSTVFTEMFQNGFVDGCPTNTLEITDMTEKGVRALLAYLYCWDQSEAIGCSSIAFELLNAGSLYDIPLLMSSMKNVFLGKPSTWFDPDVIVKLFLFGRKFSNAEGADLKQKAIKLMKENLPQIEQCSTYKELFKESPEVAMELCRIAFSA